MNRHNRSSDGSDIRILVPGIKSSSKECSILRFPQCNTPYNVSPNNIQCPDSLLPQFLSDKLRCHDDNERPLHLSLFPDWRTSDNERHLAHSSQTNKSEGFKKLSVFIWYNWKKTLTSGMKRYADTSSKVLFIKPSIPRKGTSFKQTLCLNVTASITCRHVEYLCELWEDCLEPQRTFYSCLHPQTIDYFLLLTWCAESVECFCNEPRFSPAASTEHQTALWLWAKHDAR